MKKSIIGLSFVLSSLAANAQIYIQPHVSYGLPMAQTDEGTSIVSKQTSITATQQRTATAIKSTGSSGLNAGIDIGYQMSKYIGVQLGATYLFETKRDVSNIDSTATTIGTYTFKTSTTAIDKQIRLTPAVVFSLDGKVAPYLRLGAILPVMAETNFTTNTDEKTAAYTEYSLDQTEKMTYAAAVGFSGSLGAKLALNDKSGIFIEGEFNSLQLKAAKGSLTDYKKVSSFKPPVGTGASSITTTLDELKTAYRETNYVDKTDDNSNIPSGANPYDQNKPTDVKTRTFNHTNLNVRLGFRISF